MAEALYKLGYIFFNGLWESFDEDLSYRFDDNIILSRRYPDIDESIWRKWLGLKWDQVKKSNVIIEVRIPTNAPQVLDEENKAIEYECRKLWVSLMLTGSFQVKDAYFLTGGMEEGKVNIRQFFEFDTWVPSTERCKMNSSNDFVEVMTDAHINRWSDLYRRLKHIYSEKYQFRRLQTGVRCFLKACNERDIMFRFPYFVRALEALIKPDRSATTKQFVSRGGEFWGLCKYNKNFQGDATTVLKEIYQIRCDFDHVHGTSPEWKERQFLRCYQSEELARAAYNEILLNQNILGQYINDDKITMLWKNGIQGALETRAVDPFAHKQG